MAVQFDHLVIGAQSLEQGATWAERVLGVSVPAGGAHPLMGTHNLLAQMAPGYLEIIAIDPNAPAPPRNRWYGLDNPETQAALARQPGPIAWVLGTDTIAATSQVAEWSTGPVLDVARGDLTWKITVREDGSAAEGVLPTLIEWPEASPAANLPDLGLRLQHLTLRHPRPERLRAALASVGAVEDDMQSDPLGFEIRIEPPSEDAPLVAAEIATPGGLVLL
ncbi:MAG: VOC family protein [Pseudomonadota bacterium]